MILEKVKQRTLQATGLSQDELEQLIHADDSILHDPFLYDGMDVLVDKLHAFKALQVQNPNELLVIDTDYDTDGIMSASVLSAALDVFNINHRVYIPSMAQGYGLSPFAIREMKQLYEKGDYHIHTILTADNGTSAIKGVDEAVAQGIRVLVTDHHLGGETYANADVIVNPNKQLPNGEEEPYPFKGNAGATVAWKSMLAYAERYAQDKKDLIYDLIVFAGIANVADVMPIVDENHYIVKKSVDEINRMVTIRDHYDALSFTDDARMYEHIKHTPYLHYNTVFHGLFDILMLLQASKDQAREEKGKKPIPLKTDEELIGWYLSPMLNAPRRIHATCKEGMVALLSPKPHVRYHHIQKMIDMNAEKSTLRNRVTDVLDMDALAKNHGNAVFANVRPGIAGLVAGQIQSATGRAVIVFSKKTDSDVILYDDDYFDNQHNADQLTISGSARSTNMQPLNVIMSRIHEIRPDIIAGGGGHAAAAGYAIYYKHLSVFKTLFNKVAQQVEADVLKLAQEQIASGELDTPVQNVIRLGFTERDDTADNAFINIHRVSNALVDGLKEVHAFQNTLKPFGKDFAGQTTFELEISPADLLDREYKLNLDFWKTLKFNLYGVEVLTFDIGLADELKEMIHNKVDTPIVLNAKLTMNEFRGRTTPQLQLTR